MIKKFLKKGQEIIWENGEIFINYHFSPSLMFEAFFQLNVKKFFSTPVLSAELDTINKEMIAISHLST